jgi:hypothetical protein
VIEDLGSDDILFEVEVFESQEVLFLCLPDTVYDILNVQHKICLTIPSISERHVWRIGLRNRRKRKMRRP